MFANTQGSMNEHMVRACFAPFPTNRYDVYTGSMPPYLFLVPWLWIYEPLHPHPQWAFITCYEDTFTFYYMVEHKMTDKKHSVSPSTDINCTQFII